MDDLLNAAGLTPAENALDAVKFEVDPDDLPDPIYQAPGTEALQARARVLDAAVARLLWGMSSSELPAPIQIAIWYDSALNDDETAIDLEWRAEARIVQGLGVCEEWEDSEEVLTIPMVTAADALEYCEKYAQKYGPDD